MSVLPPWLPLCNEHRAWAFQVAGRFQISLTATGGLFCELSLCHAWAEAYGNFIMIDWQKDSPQQPVPWLQGSSRNSH